MKLLWQGSNQSTEVHPYVRLKLPAMQEGGFEFKIGVMNYSKELDPFMFTFYVNPFRYWNKYNSTINISLSWGNKLWVLTPRNFQQIVWSENPEVSVAKWINFWPLSRGESGP